MTLSEDQLKAMTSIGLSPDQSATVLGHSNSFMQNTLGAMQGAANAVLSPLEDTGVRMGQGLARLTGAAAGALGNTGLQQHIESNLAQPTHNLTGGEVSPLSTDPGSAFKQIAGQSLVGGAMATPLGKLGDAASGALAPIAGKAAPILGKTLAGAGVGYAMDQGQQAAQGNTPTGKPGLGTAVGAAIPAVSGFGGMLLKHLTGFTTGAGSNVLQQAFDNPGAVQKAVNEYAQTPEATQTLVDRMKSGISSFLQDRSEQYGTTLGSLPTNGDIKPQMDVMNSFENNLSKFGGTATKDGLEFTDSTLTKADQSNLKQAYDVINNWKDTSTAGMDKMRQAVGNLMDDFKLSGNDRANVILGKVQDDLKNSVESSAPGYKNMLSTYGNQTQLARDVMKELNLSGNARPSSQLNSIMKLFNKDPQVVQKVQAIMGEKSDQFMNDLAGSILSEWLPEGKLMNALRAGGELGAAGLGFAAGGIPGAAAAVPGIAAMSPRIVGEAAMGAGALAKTGIGGLAQKAGTYLGSLMSKNSSAQPTAPAPQNASFSPEAGAAIQKGFDTGSKIDPTGSMAIEKGFAGAALSRIHPEDVAVLSKFIDGVRLNKELPMSIEHGAQALAEHWGLDVNKSAASLAGEFEKVLNGSKKVKSTNLGQFTSQ